MQARRRISGGLLASNLKRISLAMLAKLLSLKAADSRSSRSLHRYTLSGGKWWLHKLGEFWMRLIRQCLHVDEAWRQSSNVSIE